MIRIVMEVAYLVKFHQQNWTDLHQLLYIPTSVTTTSSFAVSDIKSIQWVAEQLRKFKVKERFLRVFQLIQCAFVCHPGFVCTHWMVKSVTLLLTS